MKIPGLSCVILATVVMGRTFAADPPSTTISNGLLTARLYLPDAATGFYRATRFDWSGILASLQYRGHEFVTPWFDATDPSILDLEHRGGRIVVGPGSTMVGYPEEFLSYPGKTALGWQDAPVGGTVVKIGVGVLRKPDDKPYDHFRVYEVVDTGRWTIKRRHNGVTFTQRVNDPGSGYGYAYTKRVVLVTGKPEMVLEHTLRNTGTKPIVAQVYEHNFTRWDNRPPGPDYSMSFVFPPKPDIPMDSVPVEIDGTHATFTRSLTDQDSVRIVPSGFGTDSSDYDFRFENRKLGIGLHATGDRPLAHFTIWAIRSVWAIEPFISLNIAPGAQFTWKITYDAYTLPAATP